MFRSVRSYVAIDGDLIVESVRNLNAFNQKTSLLYGQN